MNKITVLSLISFVALAGIIIAGFLVQQNEENPNSNVEHIEWEVYRNDEIGYSVEYPKGFVIDNSIKFHSDMYGNIKLDHIQISNKPGFHNEIYMGITVYNPIEDFSFEQWIKSEEDILYLSERSDIELSGVKAIKFTYNYNADSWNIYFEKSGKFFAIEAHIQKYNFFADKQALGEQEILLYRSILNHFLNSLKID